MLQRFLISLAVYALISVLVLVFDGLTSNTPLPRESDNQ